MLPRTTASPKKRSAGASKKAAKTASSPKDASDKTAKVKAMSNFASTGGAGNRFENWVQASKLLAMCLGDPSPGLADGRIVELRFQAQLQYKTDDLACTVEDSVGGRFHVPMQVKRNLRPSSTDVKFSEAITAAWIDFASSGPFVQGRDSLFILYDEASIQAMQAAIDISNTARTSSDPADFLSKVTTARVSNERNRKALKAIRLICGKQAGRALTDGEVHHFIKHLNFFAHALDRADTVEHVSYLSSIRHAIQTSGLTANQNDIWNSLVVICTELNKCGATVTLDTLDGILGARLASVFYRTRNSATTSFQFQAKNAPIATGDERLIAEMASMRAAIQALSGQVSASYETSDASPRSLNKLVSDRLNAINERIKALKFTDAIVELVEFGADQSEFDDHQKARWLMMRGACRWHLDGPAEAADDFLAAAALSVEDEKLAAARARGYLLKDDIPNALMAAKEAREKFPDSLSVWQIHANILARAGTLVTQVDIPEAFVGKAEAYQVVAWGHHYMKDLDGAVAVALESLTKEGATYFTRDLALSLVLEKVASSPLVSVFRLQSAEERTMVEKVVDAFHPFGKQLWGVQSSSSVATTTHNLAAGLLLLGRFADVLQLGTEARSHGISPPGILRFELEALSETGRKADAIEYGKFHINEMPKEGILAFASIACDVGDVETIEMAIDTIRRGHFAEPTLAITLAAMRWDTLSKKEPSKVIEEIRAKHFDESSDIAELCVAIRVTMSVDFNLANSLADIVERRATSSSDAREKMMAAQALVFARRFRSAALTFASFLPVGILSEPHKELLHCYIQLGWRARAKGLLDSLPEGWENDAEFRSMAISILHKAGDWPSLSRLAPFELAANPSSANTRVFDLSIAIRVAPEEVSTIVAALPEDLVGSISQLAQLISLELQHNQINRAMRRMYAMRRRALRNADAAVMHVVLLSVVTGKLPNMEEELSVVAPATTVTLVNDLDVSTVVSIDPPNMPSLPDDPEFVSAESDRAKLLIGRRLGETIVVTDSFQMKSNLRVTAIRSAHKRLIDIAHEVMSSPLASSQYGSSVHIKHDESGNPNLAPVAEQAKRGHERAEYVFESYKKAPITLGGIAKFLGISTVKLIRGWPTDGTPLDVCNQGPDEFKAAAAMLSDAEKQYVVDSATLAELAIGGVLHVLNALPRVFVSSATNDLVHSELSEIKVGRKVGSTFWHEGRLAFEEYSESDRARDIKFVESIIEAIGRYCAVVPSYGNETIAPELQAAQCALSFEDFEVLLLCTEKNAALLSVDARLRDLAKLFAQVDGIWPQPLVRFGTSQGIVSGREHSNAIINWFLGNRSFISVASFDLGSLILRGTAWFRFGMEMLSRYLAAETTEFVSTYRVIYGFLRMIVDGYCEVGVFLRILRRVSEAMHRNPMCPPTFTMDFRHLILNSFGDGKHTELLLESAIIDGRNDAAKASRWVPIDGVEILMCANPPQLVNSLESKISREVEAVSAQPTAESPSGEGNNPSNSRDDDYDEVVAI